MNIKLPHISASPTKSLDLHATLDRVNVIFKVVWWCASWSKPMQASQPKASAQPSQSFASPVLIMRSSCMTRISCLDLKLSSAYSYLRSNDMQIYATIHVCHRRYTCHPCMQAMLHELGWGVSTSGKNLVAPTGKIGKRLCEKR